MAFSSTPNSIRKIYGNLMFLPTSTSLSLALNKWWVVHFHISLQRCAYFLIPFQMTDLEKKIISEANRESKIIACRFPLPNLKPSRVIGEGIDTVWLYNLKDASRWSVIKLSILVAASLLLHFIVKKIMNKYLLIKKHAYGWFGLCSFWMNRFIIKFDVEIK